MSDKRKRNYVSDRYVLHMSPLNYSKYVDQKFSNQTIWSKKKVVIWSLGNFTIEIGKGQKKL